MNGRAARWALSLLWPGAVAGGGSRLTILRHHRVYAEGERPLYRLGVSERVFEAQVRLLRRLGLGPLSVTEGLARLEEGRPGHWVAMSFDDGYADNVERALPILTSAGAGATFYLTAGLIDDRRAPWWDAVADALDRTRLASVTWKAGGESVELGLMDRASRQRSLMRLLPFFRTGPAEQMERVISLRSALGVEGEPPCRLATWEQASLLAEAGMEIGAHTLTHPYLDWLSAAEQEREIGGSVERIATRLGVRPRGLAYPGGAYVAASIEAARAAGLEHAVTTRAGDHRGTAPRFELRRRGFDEGACLDPAGRFSARLARAELEGAFDLLRRTRRAVA